MSEKDLSPRSLHMDPTHQSRRSKRVIAPLLRALLLTLVASSFFALCSSTSATGATSKVTNQESVKESPKSKKKAAEKKAAKKKAAEKKARQERKARLNPQISPPPKWPPKGFEKNNGVYAKIPTRRELRGLVSASTPLFKKVVACEKVACRPLVVVSEEKCLWWEVLSTVTGPKTSDSATITSYGSLTTITKGSEEREQKVIMLLSQEPLVPGVEIENINIRCHRSGEKGKSGNVYLPFPDRG